MQGTSIQNKGLCKNDDGLQEYVLHTVYGNSSGV